MEWCLENLDHFGDEKAYAVVALLSAFPFLVKVGICDPDPDLICDPYLDGIYDPDLDVICDPDPHVICDPDHVCPIFVLLKHDL